MDAHKAGVMIARITLLFVALTVALCTPAHAAGTYTFDVTASFAPMPGANPANPFGAIDYPDYPLSGTWRFMQAIAASHPAGSGDATTGAYQTLDLPTSATRTPFPPSGPTMPAIIGSEPALDGSVRPYFVENEGPNPVTFANATFGVHELVVSPGTTQNSIVAFRVPLAGTWTVTGSLVDAAPSCGDGVDYWIDKNAGNLVNGGLANGGTASLAAAADTSIALTTSDTVYLTLGSRGNGMCDATTVTLGLVFDDPGAPAPTIADTVPPARTNVSQPSFSGTISNAFGDAKAAALEIVDTSAPDTVVRTLATHVTGSNWTAAWADATPATALPDGDYSVRVIQSDEATPANSTAVARALAIDTVSPTVTLTGGPDAVANVQPSTFTGDAGSADGDADTVSVKIYAGTEASGTPVRILTGPRTGTTYSVNYSGGDLPDGPYVAQAEQTDDAGNPAGKSAAYPFTIDTAAPAPTISNPGPGETLSDETPTISGTAGTAARDGSSVQVEFYAASVDDANLLPALEKNPTVQPDGTWSVDSDTLAPDGVYAVRVTQEDSLHNVQAPASRPTVSFTIDTSGPDVSLNAVAPLSDDTTPNFSGSAGQGAGDGDVVVNIYPGLAASGTPQTVTTTPVLGVWGPTADNLVAPPLDDGFYTAQATQADNAAPSPHIGRSDPQTFHVDLNAPEVAITAPSADALLNDDTPAITGTAGTISDDSDTVTLKVYAGDDVTDPLVQTLTTRRSGGVWSRSLAPLDDGKYTVLAEQADQIGHTGQSNTRTFDIDATAPSVTLDNPATGSVSSGGPTVSGTMSESGQPVSIKVYRGVEAAGTPAYSFAADVNGTSYSKLLTGLEDGTYTLQAQQTDLGGNVGRSGSDPVIRVDSVKPVVTLTTPEAGSATTDTTPTIAGTAGSAAGDDGTVTVLFARVNANGTTTPLPSKTTGVTNGMFGVDSDPLTEGPYVVQAVQGDSAGNSGNSGAPRRFDVDTSVPVVTLSAPAGASTTGTRTPTFSGIAGHADRDASKVTVRIYRGESTALTPVQSLVADVGTGNAFSVTPTTPLDPDGTYTAQAEQADSAGHTGHSSAHTFTVDTTGPTVTFTPPAPAGTDTTPTFSGMAGAGDGAVTVKVYAGGEATGTALRTLTATPATSGAWTVDAAPALPDAPYTAVATQTDAAGNAGTSPARSFRIDTTAPAPTLTRPAAGSRIAGSTPAFAGAAGHGTGDAATVTIRIYSGSSATGTPLQTLTAPVGADGSWTGLADSALDDGTFAVQVTQADDAGNSGQSAASTFVVKVAADVPPDTTAPTALVTLPIQRVARRVRAGFLLADLTVDEPSNAIVIATIGTRAARKLGLKTPPLAFNRKLVAIGQGGAANTDGKLRIRLSLTRAAIAALSGAGNMTVTAVAVVADLVGNRTLATTRARLVR